MACGKKDDGTFTGICKDDQEQGEERLCLDSEATWSCLSAKLCKSHAKTHQARG